MERRSFLKLLSLAAGGAYLSRPALGEIERALIGEAALPSSDCIFRIGGIDLGPWLRVVEMTRSESLLEVTTHSDLQSTFIPGPRSSTLRVGVADDLPDAVGYPLIELLLGSNGPHKYEVGHRPTGWLWSGQAHFVELARSHPGPAFECTFLPLGPAELHTL